MKALNPADALHFAEDLLVEKFYKELAEGYQKLLETSLTKVGRIIKVGNKPATLIENQ